jgi:hypothetical protein
VLEHSAGQDPAAVVTECHRALHDTRGAAVSLASIDLGKDTMSWLGVGNVEARLLRARELVPVADSPLLHSGIVGLDLPRIAVQSTNIARGDVLIFATDGIRREFADDLAPTGSCQDIAERILHQHTLGTDDALVLVARYLERR